jgi:hypothetical protein
VVVLPGLAFNLETLKAVGPPELATNPQAATIGSLGPDIFRFLPPSSALVSAFAPGGDLAGNNLALLQTAIADPASLTPAQQATLVGLVPTAVPLLLELWAKPIGTTYALLFGATGLNVAATWPLLNQVESLLATISSIVQGENLANRAASEIALAEQIPNVTSVMNSLGQLTSLSANLTSLAAQVGFVLALGPWMEEPLLSALQTIDPSLGALPTQSDQAGCRLFEFLRWHRAGEFTTNLASLARTPNEKAFAEGWSCHLAASVTAEPFVNNIVGGPYRTHWWRNMFVQNYVDAWIFGFVKTPATMAGDEPTPAYVSWASLCGANLQDEFNIGGSLVTPAPTVGVPAAVTAMASGDLTALIATLPGELDEISALFDAAIEKTYPAHELALVGATSLPSVGRATFAPGVFKSAYIGAFAVYWFLTSGTGPFGNNTLGTPPPNCGMTAPPFITSGTAPSPTQAGLSIPGAVSAAILAILALLSLVEGDVPAALALLAAAMESPVVNWDVVACNLFWSQNKLLTEENALRDLLVYLGLAYPPPILLGGTDVNGNTQPATDLSPEPNLQQPQTDPTGNVPPTLGVPVTRSNSLRLDDADEYPAAMDTTVQNEADLDFLSFPFAASVPTERVATSSLVPPMLYPNVVFDTPLNNNGLMGAGGTYPSLQKLLGGSVANAVQVLQADPKEPIPNFNLDADRGYGWLGWHPALGSNPAAPPVQDQEDH